MVSDGKYHTVELLTVKKNFTLKVDQGRARSIVNEGNKEYLRLTSPLYVGGMPAEPGQEATSKFHLRNNTSFDGRFRTRIVDTRQNDHNYTAASHFQAA